MLKNKSIEERIRDRIVELSGKYSIVAYESKKIELNTFLLIKSIKKKSKKENYKDCLKILKSSNREDLLMKISYWILLEEEMIEIQEKKFKINV